MSSQVTDIMNARPYTVRAEDPLRTASDIALERHIRSLPVTEDADRCLAQALPPRVRRARGTRPPKRSRP